MWWTHITDTTNTKTNIRADEADPFAAYELWGQILWYDEDNIIFFASIISKVDWDNKIDGVKGPMLFLAFKRPRTHNQWDVRQLLYLNYAWIDDLYIVDQNLEQSLPDEVVRLAKAYNLI